MHEFIHLLMWNNDESFEDFSKSETGSRNEAGCHAYLGHILTYPDLMHRKTNCPKGQDLYSLEGPRGGLYPTGWSLSILLLRKTHAWENNSEGTIEPIRNYNKIINKNN